MYFSGEALAQHLRPWVPFLASGWGLGVGNKQQ
jgi:hypothetical protein